jgi:iron complex outermembrane receptor protein/hemoglobin/transferrin/lactoferrin receptor protein
VSLTSGTAAALLVALAAALALAGPPARADGSAAEAADAGIAPADDAPIYETVVTAERPPTARLPEGRAGSELRRAEIERRLPRSAPDALRYEPGVFVQQTAHGQGSAFIRGLTGQQTLLLFDGVRLNNSTYRQGPNQYFFTLDSNTIEAIQVARGGASTRYGSDALGGVIMALPIEPRLAAPGDRAAATWDPHAVFRAASADEEIGGRVQTNVTLGRSLAAFGGVGARRAGLLESGGAVRSPEDGSVPPVPHFAADGRTQLGTGFEELTGDGSVVYEVNARHRLELSAYAYREYDAPRTDHCPSAYAPHDECLRYDEQFRTLAYGVWEGEPARALLDDLRVTFSYQQQHERRTLSRPYAFVETVGRDDVHTFGATLAASTRAARIPRRLDLRLDYGTDTYHDIVRSAAWITFSDIRWTERLDRGQYVDGSTYTYGGAFAQASSTLIERITLRAGGRVSWIAAHAPAVAAAGSRAVDRSWTPLVGNGGVEVAPFRWLSLVVNADRSFRAPNLNDLTSRQQTGPGYQFENASLRPEIAGTYELGARVDGPVRAELWAFRTLLEGMMARNPVPASECPPQTPECEASWSRLRLENAAELSEIRGLEAFLAADLPGGFAARLTLAWTWGEGPNPADPPSDPALGDDARVPLSRIPPLNGTAELLWRGERGLSCGASLRWASAQDRLAVSDLSDARIPAGGTPGFAVLDLRASYRLRDLLLVSLAFENVFDAAYRYHGSSVNGPGRGVVLLLDLGPIWRL